MFVCFSKNFAILCFECIEVCKLCFECKVTFLTRNGQKHGKKCRRLLGIINSYGIYPKNA